MLSFISGFILFIIYLFIGIDYLVQDGIFALLVYLRKKEVYLTQTENKFYGKLSSRGRDTIALEMPDISYFSTNRSGGLEENCWEAENKLLTYRMSDFRCRDFNVTRYQIYCKEDCCMRSLNVGNSFMGLSVVRQGIVECFLSETRDKRIWREGHTNMIVSSGIKEERNLFRKGDTLGMTSILVSPDFFRHLSERYTEYFGASYLRFGRGDFLYRHQESLDSNRFICGVE